MVRGFKAVLNIELSCSVWVSVLFLSHNNLPHKANELGVGVQFMTVFHIFWNKEPLFIKLNKKQTAIQGQFHLCGPEEIFLIQSKFIIWRSLMSDEFTMASVCKHGNSIIILMWYQWGWYFSENHSAAGDLAILHDPIYYVSTRAGEGTHKTMQKQIKIHSEWSRMIFSDCLTLLV